MSKMFNLIKKYSDEIKNERSSVGVSLAIMEEVGELARELRVKYDDSCYKEKGKDGILGESCDILISLIDLLILEGYTEEQVINSIKNKCEKWKSKTLIHKMKEEIFIYDTTVSRNSDIRQNSSLFYLEDETPMEIKVGTDKHGQYAFYVDCSKNARIYDKKGNRVNSADIRHMYKTDIELENAIKNEEIVIAENNYFDIMIYDCQKDKSYLTNYTIYNLNEIHNFENMEDNDDDKYLIKQLIAEHLEYHK